MTRPGLFSSGPRTTIASRSMPLRLLIGYSRGQMANVRRLGDLDRRGDPGPRHGSGPAVINVGGENGSVLPPLHDILFPFFDIRTFVFAVTVVQIMMFVITLIVGAVEYDGAFVKSNEMAGPSSQTFLALGAKQYDLIRKGEVWRLLIPVFLHGGIMHLAFNLYFQCNVGFQYEKLWGTKRLACIYFITAIGGSVLSTVADKSSISVGASGALFGILGAQISFLAMNWEDLPNAKQSLISVIMIVVINFLLGASQSLIDNYAHLGGLVSGLLVGCAFVKNYNWRGNEKVYAQVGAALSLAYFVGMMAAIYA